MNHYARWIIKQRAWVIGVILALTAVLAFNTPELKMKVDPAALVPANNAAVQAIDTIDAKFGSKYMMVIGITPKQGDIFQPAVLERVARITQQLTEVPVVVKSNLLSLAARQARNIQGHSEGFDARPLMEQVPRTAADYATLKAAILANPIYLGTVVSRDFKTAAILVEIKDQPLSVGEILKPILDIVAAENAPEVDIALGGNPIYIDKTEQFGSRINWLFPLAIVMIGLLHFEAFRTKQGLILPLVTALLAVLWGMGAMGLMHQPLDIFNSPTPILILAIAAGHAVQLLKRYYEEYERLRLQDMTPVAANTEATIRSLVGVGPVMLIAGGAASLGFFSLLSFEIPTIRSFGVFTGVGILSALCLEMTFIPAVRSLLVPPSDSDRRTEAKIRLWDRLPQWLGQLSLTPSNRRALYGATLLTVLLCVLGISLLHIDNSSKNYFSNQLVMQQDDQFLNQQLAGTNTLYLMVSGKHADTIKDPKVLRAIDELQRYIEAQPHVGKTLSIVDFLKRMHRAMHADERQFDTVPNTHDLIAQYLLLYSISGELGDFDSFVDYNYQAAKITVLLKTGSNAYIKQLMQQLNQHIAQTFGDDIHVSYGGDTAMTIVLSDAMVYGKLRNIVQICVAVFLITALVFRSVVGGLIVLMPVLLAVGAVFGSMGLLGIPLNIPNALISAMAVGIGADYAIYMLYRLREQIAVGQDEIQAVRTTLASAGKACLFVATAVAGGYGVLAASVGYNIHQWLALFIIIAMSVSALAALTLVPAVVLSLRPAFIFNPERKTYAALQAALSIAIAMLCLALIPKFAHAAEIATETEASIMQKSLDAWKVNSSESAATFVLTNREGESRKRLTSGLTKLHDGNDNMRVVKFLSPTDISGTATLIVEHSDKEDELWIYLPALKKVRRLAANNKKDSFVGTDFSYGDMIGHKVNEWQHHLLREEALEGAPCFVIESVPNDASIQNNSGYSRRISWIRKDNYIAVRTDIWDTAKQLYKRLKFSDIRAVGTHGKWQPMLMEAENFQTGHHTRIEITTFTADQPLRDALFTPRYLEQ